MVDNVARSADSNEKCTCHYEAPEHCKHHGPLLKVSAPVFDPLRDQDKIQRLLRLLDRYTEMGIGTVAGVLQEARNIIGPAHETPEQLLSGLTDAQREQAAENLLTIIDVTSALEKKTPKELVDLVLGELAAMDVSSVQELLIEELCTRVHPNWCNEDPTSEKAAEYQQPFPSEQP